MNKVMMIVTSVSLAAALLAGPTQAAFPALTKIYRFTGIVNKPQGSPIPHVIPEQTVIQCTNWSPNAAQIQIITYDGDTGATLTGPVYPLAHLRTITVVTSLIASAGSPYLLPDHDMKMGLLLDGSMEIRATAPQVHCDVKHVWYHGVLGVCTDVSLVINSLNGVRYNQEAGAQE